MIISASRRTDIPTYYSQWFYNRIKEGFVLVRNPMNIHQISKINLSPDVVDAIVFWTKNPAPMIERLDEIKDYNYYFQFTLNSYGTDIEANVPNKNDKVIPTFKKLSDKIGKEKVIWRYDPILLNDKYTVDYHIEFFDKLASMLSNYTEKCVISFIDSYTKISKALKENNINEPTMIEMHTIAKSFSEIARKYNLKLTSCAEKVDLSQYGIEHGKCIDDKLIERIAGFSLNVDKDKNQRLECGCVASVDIGMYNTCKNGCKYCYANYSEKQVDNNFIKHDPQSALLYGEITDEDKISDRKVTSCRECQMNLFE